MALLREVAHAHGVDDLSVGVTAFPAQHAMEQWRQQGLDVLRAKQDAGADFAITQVFYDVSQYDGPSARRARGGHHHADRARGNAAGLHAARHARASSSRAFRRRANCVAALEAAEADDAAARAAGVAHAAQLSHELARGGRAWHPHHHVQPSRGRA